MARHQTLPEPATITTVMPSAAAHITAAALGIMVWHMLSNAPSILVAGRLLGLKHCSATVGAGAIVYLVTEGCRQPAKQGRRKNQQ